MFEIPGVKNQPDFVNYTHCFCSVFFFSLLGRGGVGFGFFFSTKGGIREKAKPVK